MSISVEGYKRRQDVEIQTKLARPFTNIMLSLEDLIEQVLSMTCKHKEYINTNIAFTTLGRIHNTSKAMETVSCICMCKKCGVLFVPFELRSIPNLDTIRTLEEKNKSTTPA